MEQDAKVKLNEFDAKFKALKTKILRINATKDEKKINKYIKEVVDAYNSFVLFASPLFAKADFNLQLLLRNHFIKYRDNTVALFAVLKVEYAPTNSLHKQIELQIEVDSNPSSSPPASPLSNSPPPSPPPSPNMSELTNIQFINACSRHITINYDGKFETLRSFIQKVKFLQTLATTEELSNTLTAYVMTKLDQKALSKVSEDPQNVDEIINCLKKKVTHESSKVLEGRMIALAIDNKPMATFQKQADSLADDYQQALVEEGIPLQIAEKLTLDKTIDLCRKNSKSSEVRAIICTSKYKTPADVVAVMVTEKCTAFGQGRKSYY